MSNVLLLTGGHEPPADILPSLTLLPHAVRVAPAVAASVAGSPVPDVVLVDARRDLVQAKRLVQALRGVDRALPVLVIVTEGGWAALAADWGADDVVLYTPRARARLTRASGWPSGASAGAAPEQSGEIRSGELVINEVTYSARMNGRSLDLTFKEFELLKFLAQQPGRVFTRAQLLQEVWGYDYFGGTRTVDVHVRRLRAKLGAGERGPDRHRAQRRLPVRARPAERPPGRHRRRRGAGCGRRRALARRTAARTTQPTKRAPRRPASRARPTGPSPASRLRRARAAGRAPRPAATLTTAA